MATFAQQNLSPHASSSLSSPSSGAWYASTLSSPGSGPSSSAMPVSPREKMRQAKQALIRDEIREATASKERRRTLRENSIMAQIASAGLQKSAFPTGMVAAGLSDQWCQAEGDIRGLISQTAGANGTLKRIPPQGILRKPSLVSLTPDSPQSSLRDLSISRPTSATPNTDFGPAMPGGDATLTERPPLISTRRRSSKVRFSSEHLPSAKSNPASIAGLSMSRENSLEPPRLDGSQTSVASIQEEVVSPKADPVPRMEERVEQKEEVEILAPVPEAAVQLRPAMLSRNSDTSAISIATIAQEEQPRGLSQAVSAPIQGKSRLESGLEDMFTPQPLPYPQLSKVLARLSTEGASLDVLNKMEPPPRTESIDWASFVPNAPTAPMASRLPSMVCPSSAPSTRESMASVAPSFSGASAVSSARSSVFAPNQSFVSFGAASFASASRSSTSSGLPERMSQSVAGAAYAALLPALRSGRPSDAQETPVPQINRQHWEDADLGLSPRSGPSPIPSATGVDFTASPPRDSTDTMEIVGSPAPLSRSPEMAGSAESYVVPLGDPIDSRASTIDSYYQSDIPERHKRDYHLDSVDLLSDAPSPARPSVEESPAAKVAYLTMGQKAAAVFNAAHSPQMTVPLGHLPSQLPVFPRGAQPAILKDPPYSPLNSPTPANSQKFRRTRGQSPTDSLSSALGHSRAGSDFSVDLSFPLPPDRLNVTIGKLVLPATRRKKASISQAPTFMAAEAVVEVSSDTDAADERVIPATPTVEDKRPQQLAVALGSSQGMPASRLMEDSDAVKSSPCPDAYSLTAAVMQVGSPIRESPPSLKGSPAVTTVPSVGQVWAAHSPASSSGDAAFIVASANASPMASASAESSRKFAPRPESPDLQEVIAQTLRTRRSTIGYNFADGSDDDLDRATPLLEAAVKSNILSPNSRLLHTHTQTSASPSHSPSSSKSSHSPSMTGKVPTAASPTTRTLPRRASTISSADLRSGVSLTKGKGWSGSESEEEGWATTVRLISLRKASLRKPSPSPVSPITAGGMAGKRPRWAQTTAEERYSDLSNASHRTIDSETSLATPSLVTPITPIGPTQTSYIGKAGERKRPDSNVSAGSEPGRFPWGKSSPILTSTILETYESVLDNPALRLAIGYDPNKSPIANGQVKPESPSLKQGVRAVSLPAPVQAPASTKSSAVTPPQSIATSPVASPRTPALRIKKKDSPVVARRSLPKPPKMDLPKPTSDVGVWGEPEVLIDEIDFDGKPDWETGNSSASQTQSTVEPSIANTLAIDVEDATVKTSGHAGTAPMPAPVRAESAEEEKTRKDSLAAKAEAMILRAEEVAERTRLAILESTKVMSDALSSTITEEPQEELELFHSSPNVETDLSIPVSDAVTPPRSLIPRSTSQPKLRKKSSVSRIPVPTVKPLKPRTSARAIEKPAAPAPVAPAAIAPTPTAIIPAGTANPVDDIAPATVPPTAQPVSPEVTQSISDKMSLAEFKVRAKIRALEAAKEMGRSVSADSDGKVATAGMDGLSSFSFWNEIATDQISLDEDTVSPRSSLSLAKSKSMGALTSPPNRSISKIPTPSKIPATRNPVSPSGAPSTAVPSTPVASPKKAGFAMQETQSAGPVMEHSANGMGQNPKLFPVTAPRALYTASLTNKASEAFRSIRVWPSAPAVPTLSSIEPRPSVLPTGGQSKSEPLVITLNEPTPTPEATKQVPTPEFPPLTGSTDEEILASLLGHEEERVPLSARLAGLIGISPSSSNSSLRSTATTSDVSSPGISPTSSVSQSKIPVPVTPVSKIPVLTRSTGGKPTLPPSVTVSTPSSPKSVEAEAAAQADEMGVFRFRGPWFSSPKSAVSPPATPPASIKSPVLGKSPAHSAHRFF